MDSILKSIEDWIRSMLVSGIMDSLDKIFSTVNRQVGEISTEVGTTPADFQPAVYGMIRTLSENVIMPIAGIVLTFIACYELIQLVIGHNNLANFETWIFWKWTFKTFIAVMLISNTMNITMAVFDVAQHVVNESGGIISGSTAIDDDDFEDMEEDLEEMDVGPLLVIFLQSLIVQFMMLIMSALIFVIVYLRYGEESYTFKLERSKDKELGLFYDIIMDKDNQQIDQDNEIMMYLAEVERSDLFESQIEDFMSRIMIDVEEHAKENLSGNKTGARSMGIYVDYRTYLDYDIIVKNCVTGMEVPLSKVSGEGSGGENQAPFYVAICASLLQIYEQNPEGCIKLVLLDEAFNNMTSDRIEPMMNMFKALNLQLILIATAEKATVIIPYCDITYSIVKSGNRNAIGVFERTNANGIQ